MLFSIKSNILLSSILVFFWWVSFPFKMDTLENEIHKKLYLKKNEGKFFKEWDLPQNDIIWSKMRTRLDEVKKDAITIPRNKKNTLHILKANFVSQRHIHTKYHFIRLLLFNTFLQAILYSTWIFCTVFTSSTLLM